ncbi:hypothetical protein Gohar_009230, partial [Gossypium harknessii]|nr:hypothetical protein [Gossypium harknessii]
EVKLPTESFNIEHDGNRKLVVDTPYNEVINSDILIVETDYNEVKLPVEFFNIGHDHNEKLVNDTAYDEVTNGRVSIAETEQNEANFPAKCLNIGHGDKKKLAVNKANYKEAINDGKSLVETEQNKAKLPIEPLGVGLDDNEKLQKPETKAENKVGEMSNRRTKGVGGLLRVNNLMMSEERGRFACLFVKINLEKLLQKFVFMEGRKQAIVYEGIEKLCFECGMVGHKVELCIEK